MDEAEHLKNEALQHAANGEWDKAIQVGKRVPMGMDVWQQMPSINPKGMPKEAVSKVLDLLERANRTARSGFIHYIANSHSYNMDHDTALIHRLWMLAGPTDEQARSALEGHPNFKITSDLHGPGNFWATYEKKVDPSHFAAIEAWKKGKDIKLTDHRGNTGSSDSWIHTFPHMEAYAAASQRAILNDPTFEKRRSGNKTYVQLYRGVGGNYGKAIHGAFGFNNQTREADLNKKVVVPTTTFSSWTRDKDMASRFAEGRGGIPGNVKDGGVVIKKWVPIENILHSGRHDLYPGQPKIHVREENEVVVHHPNKKMRISGEDLMFPTQVKGDYGTVYDKGTDRGIHLEKGRMKDFTSALGIAASMLGYPVPTDFGPESPRSEINAIQAIDHTSPHPSLEAIKMVESSGNRNTAHTPVEHNLNAGTAAIGMYGFMPLQVQDTVMFDPKLRHKYQDLAQMDPVANQQQMKQFLEQNEPIQHELANSHWKRLSDRFDGDEKRMAYAWKNGIAGALKASDEEVASNPYVRKYLSYKKLLDVEDKSDPVHKTEQNLADKVKNIRRFISVDPANKHIGETVTEMIQDGQVHDMSNLGHFTHSSFIVGPDDKTAWLIKVESEARPAIKSAQYGLQTVKEAAFYEAARKVFGLDEYVPEAYLGELQKRIPNSDRVEYIPAVAIKLLPKSFRMAADYEREKPGSMEGILEPYRKAGILHKIAAMYIILGEADSHGKNIMTDGKHIALIDHGTSFADASFDPANDNKVFIPYILRVKRIKDNMSKDTKMSLLATVHTPEVLNDIKTYILSLSEEALQKILAQYDIDPAPEIERLRALKSAVLKEDPAIAINRFWVFGYI